MVSMNLVNLLRRTRSLAFASLSVGLPFSFASLAIVSLASAEPIQLAARSDQTCALSTDPHEMPMRISEASATEKGICVNTGRYRSIQELSVDQAAQVVTFYNFRYRGRFWKAEVPIAPEAIRDALFQIKHIPTVKNVRAAHTQMRYRLAPNRYISLVDQENGEIVRVRDIAVSFEAALPVDGQFNIALAVLPMYPLVGRVGDAESIVRERPFPVEQYELNLTPNERVEVLLASLQRSQDIGLAYFYNTLRPNCTTEQFDLFDRLPRMNGRFGKFVVAFSPDPVAGPSLEALSERGLIKRRIQDFADDLKGVVAELPMPEDNRRLAPFLPAVANMPWSIVIGNPDPSTLTESDRVVVKKLKGRIVEAVIRVASLYSFARSVESVSEGKLNLVEQLRLMNDIQNELQIVVREFDQGVGAFNLGVYMMPFPTNRGYTSLENMGLNLAIPMPVHEIILKEGPVKTADIFQTMRSVQLKEAIDMRKSDQPAYLMASALVVHARHMNSSVTLQTMVGLQPFEKPFNKVNSQVAIQDIILKAPTNLMDQPVLLVTNRQKAKPSPIPSVRVEFGTADGLVGESDPTRVGLMQLWRSEGETPKLSGGDCEVRMNAVPTLVGKLAEQTSGFRLLDRILKGADVSFHILSLNVNYLTGDIESMDIRTSVPPLKCLDLNEVKVQFKNQANSDITRLREKAGKAADTYKQSQEVYQDAKTTYDIALGLKEALKQIGQFFGKTTPQAP